MKFKLPKFDLSFELLSLAFGSGPFELELFLCTLYITDDERTKGICPSLFAIICNRAQGIAALEILGITII